MVIYDPPSASADRAAWEAYLAELSSPKDNAEIERVKKFMALRFAPSGLMGLISAGSW